MSNRCVGEKLGWVGAVVGGAWLAIWTARCLAATMERVVSAAGTDRPVIGMVEEALAERREADTMMADAFEEALAEERSEETATVQ